MTKLESRVFVNFFLYFLSGKSFITGPYYCTGQTVPVSRPVLNGLLTGTKLIFLAVIEPACQRLMSAVAAASNNHAGVSLARIRNLAIVMIDTGYDLFLGKALSISSDRMRSLHGCRTAGVARRRHARVLCSPCRCQHETLCRKEKGVQVQVLE